MFKSNIFFCYHGHMRSYHKYKTLYFNFWETMSTKLEIDMVTWHNSRVTSKKRYIDIFTCLMTTRLGTMILWYWVTIHKVAWFFNHVIMCSPVTNKMQYMSNFTSPMDTKLDRVVAYDMGPNLKKSHHFFHSLIFSRLKIVLSIWNRATIRLLLLVS